MSDSVQSTTEVLSTLRAFQRRTATYAFSRLYDDENPSLRFLVADEVGLGKTVVARGVIAQVIEHLRNLRDRRIDIVYICSNGAIARQNLRKLNVAGSDAIVQADRFTLLANEMKKLERRSINLVAVTPGTSMNFGNSPGTIKERSLLYAILQRIWGEDAMRGSGEERVFYFGINDDGTARRRLREKAARRNPSRQVIKAFRAEIRVINERRRERGEPSLKVEFNRLARAFHYKDQHEREDRLQRNRFILELRQALATVGIEALQPDLVILDEFQRFRDLLDPTDDSWATRLARKLFDFRASDTGRPTRTLLLSATPYRPYTTADDADGDSHFEDFVHTARFLLNDAHAAEALRADLRDLRRGLLALDRDEGAAAVAACRRVGERLRPVMVRTERLASTPDRNGMLEAREWSTELSGSDIDGYLAISTAAEIVGHRDVVEFWKSGPYLLNFMENYALKRSFEDSVEGGAASTELRDLVANGRGLLNWDEITRYEQLDPANARLRALIGDTVERDLWQILWLPPSLPYYRTEAAFDRPEIRSFTKRLIFSAWQLVPKVISAMLSYETERRAFAGIPSEARGYTEMGQRPDRLLDFRMEGPEPGAMATLNLVVPWVELARIVDPLVHYLESANNSELISVDVVLGEAQAAIHRALRPMVRGTPVTGQVDQRWYWAAPLLLDLGAGSDAAIQWWAREAKAATWTGESGLESEGSNFGHHLALAAGVQNALDAEPLGRVPDDIDAVLARVALGAPAVCALRALSRVCEKPIGHDAELLRGAARIGWGFRALFNSPESTAIVRQVTPAEAYWRSALDYGVSGNLQAVLDEYVHVLKDWRGFLSPGDEGVIPDLANTAFDALTLRTVTYRTDIPRVAGELIHVDRRGMRGRFAIRFGDQAIESDAQQQRAEQASIAFNSPFWPFVLSTTSVGQEGLDFHLYSHAVVHWNLPTNPVDFEQREGRVHRYKGHAVRRNLAVAYGDTLNSNAITDPWSAMFTAASAEHGAATGELAPCWVFAPKDSPARIERYVPVLPLSRDAARLEKLLEAVATYRLSFGQPRQEELLRYLRGRIDEQGLAKLSSALRVDLNPP